MLDSSSEYIIATDGATGERNPGYMGTGVAVFDKEGRLVDQVHNKMHWGTNAQAEYLALIDGLKYATSNGLTNVTIYVDSQMIVRQLTKEWSTRNQALRNLRQTVMTLINSIKGYGGEFRISWHNRERRMAKVADNLSKGNFYRKGAYVWQIA
jgi:ribonuclease HI